MFWFGTNCATCALQCSIVRAEVDEEGAVPEAQAAKVIERTEALARVMSVFMSWKRLSCALKKWECHMGF